MFCTVQHLIIFTKVSIFWCFCHRLLIIDNFIPPDDKNKILARAEFDEEEDSWRLKALAKGGCVEFFAVASRL